MTREGGNASRAPAVQAGAGTGANTGAGTNTGTGTITSGTGRGRAGLGGATARALALDIGATKIAAAVVDGAGRAIRWSRLPTQREEGPDRVVERLFELGRRTIGDDTVAVVGIACGGPLDADAGVLLGPLHLPGWDRVPIGPMAADRFGVPALLVNDGSAGAWGEFRWGAARGTASMVYLTISSGIGGGAVIDGRLLRGATTNGGEFGHVLARPGGRRCTCGRRGCVEAYAAGTQMAERARELMAAGRASALSQPHPITAERIVALVGTDELATEIWRDGVDCLAAAVTDLVNVLEPEAVVLGGGVTRSGGLLLDPVRRAVETDAMRPIARTVQVHLAALGDAAPAVGAGTLALDRALIADPGAKEAA